MKHVIDLEATEVVRSPLITPEQRANEMWRQRALIDVAEARAALERQQAAILQRNREDMAARRREVDDHYAMHRDCSLSRSEAMFIRNIGIGVASIGAVAAIAGTVISAIS